MTPFDNWLNSLCHKAVMCASSNLCFRLHTHFLVPTVSKDPLLCALNKQSLFEVELPESWARRWWRMRAARERERKREMIYLMKAELDECDRTVISQFPAVSGGKDMVSHSHLHTQFVLSITACKCTSYFPSVINRRVSDFVLVSVPGECLLCRIFGNSLCHVFVTTCVHCKHFRRVCGNSQASGTTWTIAFCSSLNYM